MKRGDLEKLGLSAEQIDSIMGMHGADIEKHKATATDLQGQLEAANKQLGEANTAIEGFKKLNVDEIQKAADDYKAKWEQAQTDAANQLAQVKFDHALSDALKAAKVRNPQTVTPLLSRDGLKLKDDGTIDGLDKQLETIKAQNDYLFEGDKPEPKIVTKTNNQPISNMSALEAAARKGGGFKMSTEGNNG